MALATDVMLFILTLSVGSLFPVLADEWPKAVNDLASSQLYCPAPVIGERCPDDTIVYYYTCCGELNNECCFVLQVWLIILLVIIGVTVVAAFLFAVLRCLFFDR